MLPFLIGGAAAILTGVGAAIYKYCWEDEPTESPANVSLKRFAIWGRPDVGKTTFIARLRGRPVDAERKVASTSKYVYQDIPPIPLDGKKYLIDEIVDMPGNKDRLADWLKFVSTHEHVFYLINLARTGDADYTAGVRYDLQETMEVLRSCNKADKKLHIIVSHIDESHLKNVNPAEVNNALHQDAIVRQFYEQVCEVRSYLYAANLMDQENFQQLIQSIIRDAND